MVAQMGARMSANAIRGYVKTLRVKRKKTQVDVAKHIDMPITTYKDWERGITKDIKTPHLLRIVQFLQGSVDQIAKFSDELTTEDGAALAEQWVEQHEVVAEFAPKPDESPREAARVNRLIELLASGVDPQEAAQIVQRGQ